MKKIIKKIKRIIRFILKPSMLIIKLGEENKIKIKDSTFLKLRYKNRIGKKLDLNNPKTFNEKLQWLKLYDRNPEYTKMVDKYEVKKYVADIVGEEYIIPTIGVYEKFEDINFDELPKQFVMKCTHDSGSTIVCKNKDEFDIESAKDKIEKGLKQNFFYLAREWPYKNVKPRIIIEKYMVDESETELKDYKLFCFEGETKVILVCSDRTSKLKETFYDSEWNLIDLIEGNHPREENIEKPFNLQKMKKIAGMLAKNIPFVRVDFYEINSKVYFGELTFYPRGGYEEFSPEEYDRILGDMISLPKKRKKEEKNEK